MTAGNRQSTFTGTKEVAERLRFDVGRLESYLRDHVEGFAGADHRPAIQGRSIQPDLSDRDAGAALRAPA